MSRLSDHELDTLLRDAQYADRMMAGIGRSERLTPRLVRLLQESRELRDQAAERQHMAEIEGDN